MCCLHLQVNGDSGNDIELFQVPGVRGCVVANAHPELMDFATGSGRLRQHQHPDCQPAVLGPCIVEALMKFGSIASPEQPAALLRGTLVQLGLLQSNALAGNLSLLAEPGASWVTPAGQGGPCGGLHE